MPKYQFIHRNSETGARELVGIAVEGQSSGQAIWRGDNQEQIKRLQATMRDEGLDPFQIGSFDAALVLFSGSYFWLSKSTEA